MGFVFTLGSCVAYGRWGLLTGIIYGNIGCTVIATVLPWESRKHLEAIDITCFDLDVTKDESVDALRAAVEKGFGDKLHILVNNA